LAAVIEETRGRARLACMVRRRLIAAR